MVTLTYLLVGKALNVFLVCKSNLNVQNSTVSEDSETNSCSLEIFFIWLQCDSGFSVAMQFQKAIANLRISQCVKSGWAT